MAAMSPSASKPPAFVVIGDPDSNRVALFRAALARRGTMPLIVVPWLDLLAGRVCLPASVPPGSVVRLESPGKDFRVERALLVRGADMCEGDPDLPRPACEQLTEDKGCIRFPRQWYGGLCSALNDVAGQLAECPPHRTMSAPEDIAVMFDKRLCHRRLAEAGVPVPKALGLVESYNELVARMREHRCPRVFVKLAHGSSASGVVAYQTDGDRHQATTTAEMVAAGDELRLYNTRRIQTTVTRARSPR